MIVSPLESPRTIGNDYVVQYQGRVLQLDRRAQSRIPVKSQVLVREARDGCIAPAWLNARKSDLATIAERESPTPAGCRSRLRKAA